MPDIRVAGAIVREALLDGEYYGGRELAFCHHYGNLILIGRIHGIENPDPGEIVAQDKETLEFFTKAIRVVANCLNFEPAQDERNIRIELNRWSNLFEISVFGLGSDSIRLLIWDIDSAFGSTDIRQSGHLGEFHMEMLRVQPQPVR